MFRQFMTTNIVQIVYESLACAWVIQSVGLIFPFYIGIIAGFIFTIAMTLLDIHFKKSF